MAASAAPAFAASPPKVYGTACELFYGAAGTNFQTHSLYLGVYTSSGIIPAGTTLTWDVTMAGGGNEIPSTNYSQTGLWTLTLSAASGTVASSFTATIVFNQDYVTGLGVGGGTWCAAALVWTDIYSILPGARVTITSNQPTGSGIIPGGAGSLSYTVADRHPQAINQTGRAPHYYTSRTGTQTCYPLVQYSRLLPNDGYDNVTCYPTGTTGLSLPCTWGTTSCASSATGLCTPRKSSTVVDTQYVTPAVC